jgi:hypothetical protein
LMGDGLGVFLGHPDLQGLPAVLEVPGKDGHGPDAEEVRKTKELHRNSVNAGPTRKRSRPRRRSGTSARRPVARRTPD